MEDPAGQGRRPPRGPAEGSAWRHVRTGRRVRVVGLAPVASSRGGLPGCRVVIYRHEDDGSLWVRHPDDFLGPDARFEELPS